MHDATDVLSSFSWVKKGREKRGEKEGDREGEKEGEKKESKKEGIKKNSKKRGREELYQKRTKIGREGLVA